MNILVVGQGGREHVLTWKLAQSKLVKKIYCAPGNFGMTPEAECVQICATDCGALADFAKDKKIDLTVVGPEAPLVEGIVDRFKREGLKVFGPDSYCAQLEGSKAFSKEVMQRLGIPTAKYKEFDSSVPALEYLKTSSYPIVIKADGLAAGKGVTIAEDYRTAEETVKFIMDNKGFGDAGAKIVVEEFLQGEEVSLIAVSDGKTILNLASSQDHKRIFDDDKGPNTGGMGAYS
ncbi:MAG: phosphoribosylamine--glycine ligase, partial [Candidatus Omnitrophica bacterium]|nr:phosphoribosylamine--glycine ligase [Candidatus Omnitrophota bacterium]